MNINHKVLNLVFRSFITLQYYKKIGHTARLYEKNNRWF